MMQVKALLPEKKWIQAAMSNSDKVDAKKVPSPCISICQMDAFDDLCLGCYRTRDEIATWGSMDQDEQIQLLDVLRDRRAKVTARCGVHRDLVKNV
tara:strand:- start:343 stop:630 length:288 start_codon:yes stop_codon:yes gene_type:complete